MEEWKEEALMWTIALVIILGTFVIGFFILVNSTHVELLDSIKIPNKPYNINAYYFDAGATGGGVGLEKVYDNGKKEVIYISDGFFNDVKALELINDNTLKVILGFKIKPNKFAKQDTVFIELESLEEE